MKYYVEIEETLTKVIEVDSADKKEAIKKVQAMYKDGDIILDSSNHIQTNFRLLDNK